MDLEWNEEKDDIIFEHGDLRTVDGQWEAAQSFKIALKTYLEEWFLDRRVGVDYFNRIFGKVDPAIRRAEIRRVQKTIVGLNEETALRIEVER